MSLEQIEKSIIRGEYVDALTQIETLYNEKRIGKEDTIQCNILKGRIYLILFPYTEAIKFGEKAFEESQEINNKQLMFDSLMIMQKAYFYAGKYEKRKEIRKLATDILDSFEEKDSEEFLRRKAILLPTREDNFNSSISNILESIAISESIDDPILKADSYSALGSRYLWAGNLSEALKYAQKSINLYEKSNYHFGLRVSTALKGIIYLHKGELTFAEEYIQKSYSLYKMANENPFFEACILMDLGLIYWLKRELQTSLQYYQKSIACCEQSQVISTRHYPWALLRMNVVLIEMGRITEAKKSLELIKQIALNTNEYVFKKIYALGKAMILKTSLDEANAKEAITLLEKLVDDKINFLELTSLSVFHLCDSYLKEIGRTNDLNFFEKLRYRVSLVNEKAERQESYILLVYSLLIQSKLELTELNISKGQILLEEAQKIAEEKGITNLAKVISNEHDVLLNQINKWEEMTKHIPNLEERLEFTHIEDILNKLIKSNISYIQLKDENEYPYFFLIVNRDGSVLFSENFRDSSLDEVILDGILAQINELILSETLSENEIKRLKSQNYTIAVSFLESFFLIYVFVGQSYTALQKIRCFMDQFNSFINNNDIRLIKEEVNNHLTLQERLMISKNIEEVFLN